VLLIVEKDFFRVNKKQKEFFMSIGARLREERERLGFTQPDFAGFAGATKQTLYSWEAGGSFPKADQLNALVDQGVDVYYVLTGQRIGAATTLSARESALLENYRAADDEAKFVVDSEFENFRVAAISLFAKD
jgi:transcriptional regulator with XRE-family HTH domain